MTTSFEHQLFGWSSWDQFDTAGFMFYDVVLAKDLGSFAAGTKFSSASICYDKSILELYKNQDDEEPTCRFRLIAEVEEDDSTS